MAGRGRTRAAAQAESVASAPSRRTTRQASATADEAAMPPPPARNTRVTRGQSKEVESEIVIGARRNAPPVPAAPVETMASDVGRPSEGLYPQSEELEEDDEQFEDAQDGTQKDSEAELPGREMELRASFNQNQSQTSQQFSRASSFLGSGSDIFARTPGGDKALARVLRNFLPQLLKSADDLQNHLYNDSDSQVWDIEYGAYKNVFTIFCEQYSNDSFIADEDVLSKLGEVHGDTAGAYYASRIIGAANITMLLCDLHRLTHESPTDNDFITELQRWDDAFPTSFLPRRDQNGTPWTSSERDFALALDLRTQRMLYTLEIYGDGLSGEHGILNWMASVWFGAPVDPQSPEFLAFMRAEDDLRGENDDGTVPLKPLAGFSLDTPQNRQYRERYVDRMREIFSILIDDDDLAITTGQLRERFKLESLMTSLTHWCHSLFHSIKKSLQATNSSGAPVIRGLLEGPREMSTAPSSYVAESQAESQVDPQMYTQSMSEGSQDIENNGANPYLMQIAHQYKEELNPQQGQSRPVPAAPPSAQHPPTQSPPEFSHDQDVLARRALLHSQATTYQPESSSYPPLADMGYTPSPVSSRPQGGGALFASSAAMTAKRQRPTQDDDDFELDTRIPNDKQQEGIVALKPKRKRQKINKPEPDLARINASRTPEGTPGGHSLSSPAEVDVDVVALSQGARLASLAARKPKVPQQRTPWTRADTKALIRAVDTYKCKWSLIESQIANGTIVFEFPRNQQALRDKARLLKQDILKTDGILPPSFDYVVLGKKEREAVIACHKNPERKEGDLDDQGRPTNIDFYQDRNGHRSVENNMQRELGQQAIQGDQPMDED